VLTCADALNIQRFILVGLSMGGAISQQIALLAPERLIGLELLSTGAKLKVIPEIFRLIRENYNQYVSLYPTMAFSKNAPKAVVEESMKVTAMIDPASADADFRACDAFNLKDQIKDIKTRTLVISASDDVLTPPKYQDYIASQIQGSKLVRVSGAGHVSNLEKPHEVNSALKEFVKEVLEKS
jgi:pimeloyl-ACP methyl ester carboxylesterase